MSKKAAFRCVVFIIGCLSSCLLTPSVAWAKPNKKPTPPRLVVGIVVDQMRPDYVYRFWDKLGNKGLKRLINKGYECNNVQYNYVPTYTAPGHASIYTGTTPASHGIVGNSWFERESGKSIYCTSDTLVRAVGGSDLAGKMSPRNLLATTITDELQLFNNGKSKVIGIALKDRGAILPAGHMADAAYWFDGQSGNFMTSTYYRTALPDWVTQFNAQNYAAQYLQQNWETLLPLAAYTESLPDNSSCETPFAGETEPVFPHKLPQIAQALTVGGYDLVRATPFGNTLTKDFAIAAIQAEKMGKTKGVTDFIAISFSSTDYVGHQFGPRSVEIEDVYLRFDRDIADLLDFLDHYIGTENTLIFLTADHAVADVPAYLQSVNIPAAVFDRTQPVQALKTQLYNRYADSLLLTFTNSQIYVNRSSIAEKQIPLEQVQDEVATFLLQVNGIANVLTSTSLNQNSYTDWRRMCLQNGYCPTRSGDVLFMLQPGWLEHEYTGTTHGSAYMYDTHVPLYWYGCGVAKGKKTSEPVFIPDIAATISVILHLPFPNACTGKPISAIISGAK